MNTIRPFTGRNLASMLWDITVSGQYWKTNKSKWSLLLNYNIAEALLHIQVIHQLFFFFFPVVAHLLHKVHCKVPMSKVRADGDAVPWPASYTYTRNHYAYS